MYSKVPYLIKFNNLLSFTMFLQTVDYLIWILLQKRNKKSLHVGGHVKK
jgi:hypothetical protein